LLKFERIDGLSDAEKKARVVSAEALLAKNGIKDTNVNLLNLGLGTISVNAFRTNGHKAKKAKTAAASN
jgi:hypothetical protein